jgi:N-acetylglucosamine-6-phosphate deacetylase
MVCCNLQLNRYTMGSLTIDIVGPTAKIVGSDTLAGSVARLDACVRNFHSFTSCSLVEAIEAASLHPVSLLPLPPSPCLLPFLLIYSRS